MSVASLDPYRAPRSPAVALPLAARDFRVRDVFGEASRTFRAQPLPLVGSFLLQQALTFFFSYGYGYAGELLTTSLPVDSTRRIAVAVFVQIFTFVTSTFLAIGMTRIALDAARGRRVRIGALFSGGDVLVSATVGGFLTIVAITLGTMAFVIPGIVLSIALGFVQTVVADRGLSAIEACKASLHLTRGARSALFLLALASFGVYVAGALALLVGLAVAMPLVQLAYAHAYVRLLDERQGLAVSSH